MRHFKCFSICYSILILFSGCTGFQTKPYSFSTSSKEFMTEYCRAGKQIKSFKTSVAYFAPNVEKGLALDKASSKNQQSSRDKDDILKNLFYYLGDSKTFAQVNNHGEEPKWYSLMASNEKDVLDNIKDEDANTKYRLTTFIVKIENANKVIVYQSNEHSRRMRYDKSYSTDLNNIFSEYTLLVPLDSDSKNLLNERKEIDISKAISRKDDLWQAYVRKFTSVKESQDDDSQKSNIELTLDLNTFCKYGRKISDLQSQ